MLQGTTNGLIIAPLKRKTSLWSSEARFYKEVEYINFGDILINNYVRLRRLPPKPLFCRSCCRIKCHRLRHTSCQNERSYKAVNTSCHNEMSHKTVKSNVLQDVTQAVYIELTCYQDCSLMSIETRFWIISAVCSAVLSPAK